MPGALVSPCGGFSFTSLSSRFVPSTETMPAEVLTDIDLYSIPGDDDEGEKSYALAGSQVLLSQRGNDGKMKFRAGVHPSMQLWPFDASQPRRSLPVLLGSRDRGSFFPTEGTFLYARNMFTGSSFYSRAVTIIEGDERARILGESQVEALHPEQKLRRHFRRALSYLYHSESEADVRLAISIMGVSRDTAYFEALSFLLNDTRPGIALEALKALSNIEDPRVKPTIVNQVTRGSTANRIWAIHIVASWNRPEDNRLFLLAQVDHHPKVREVAARLVISRIATVNNPELVKRYVDEIVALDREVSVHEEVTRENVSIPLTRMQELTQWAQSPLVEMRKSVALELGALQLDGGLDLLREMLVQNWNNFEVLFAVMCAILNILDDSQLRQFLDADDRTRGMRDLDALIAERSRAETFQQNMSYDEGDDDHELLQGLSHFKIIRERVEADPNLSDDYKLTFLEERFETTPDELELDVVTYLVENGAIDEALIDRLLEYLRGTANVPFHALQAYVHTLAVKVQLYLFSSD